MDSRALEVSVVDLNVAPATSLATYSELTPYVAHADRSDTLCYGVKISAILKGSVFHAPMRFGAPPQSIEYTLEKSTPISWCIGCIIVDTLW